MGKKLDRGSLVHRKTHREVIGKAVAKKVLEEGCGRLQKRRDLEHRDPTYRYLFQRLVARRRKLQLEETGIITGCSPSERGP